MTQPPIVANFARLRNCEFTGLGQLTTDVSLMVSILSLYLGIPQLAIWLKLGV